MSLAFAALLLAPAHAEQAMAPDVDDCQVWVSDSVPQRNTSDVPTDIQPVVFTQGGCDTFVRIELIDDDGNLWLSQDEQLSGRRAIELETSGLTTGAYAIRIVDTDRFVLDRIDFWVGEDAAGPLPEVEVRLDAWGSGYETYVYVALDEPIENGMISVTSPSGETAKGPAWSGSELVFSESFEGETCFTVSLRGPAGDWSEPTEQCVQAYIEDDDFRCGVGFPFGCSNLGGSAPAGGILVLAVAGLARRRR